MAEILGAVAAGVALCTQVTQCGLAIRKATKKIKNSRRDIAELSDETVIFAGLCEEFLRECAEKHEGNAGASSSIGPLNIWINKTRAGLRELLRKVEALRPDPRYRYSVQDTLIAYLEWFFSKASVKSLRASMAVARESIKGFSNLICIKKLNKELRMLRIALARPWSRNEIEQELGMKIEDKIQLVQQAIEIKSIVHDTNKRQLRAAKREITSPQSKIDSSNLVPAPTELLKFTASLDTYAEEILPSGRSSRRSNGSRSSKYTSTVSEPWSPLYQRPSESTRAHGSSDHMSSSMSTVSTNSSQAPIVISSSISAVSTAAKDTVEPTLSQRKTTRPSPESSGTVERPDMRAREYINDPNGDILSPPKLKAPGVSTPMRKTAQIGRHNIVLDAKYLIINAHSLHVGDYAVGLKFFRTLMAHKDKLDKLDEALGQKESWYGIPDWVVNCIGVFNQPSALGIRDV